MKRDGNANATKLGRRGEARPPVASCSETFGGRFVRFETEGKRFFW